MNSVPLKLLVEEIFTRMGCQDCPSEITLEKIYESDKPRYCVSVSHEETCPRYLVMPETMRSREE